MTMINMIRPIIITPKSGIIIMTPPTPTIISIMFVIIGKEARVVEKNPKEKIIIPPEDPRKVREAVHNVIAVDPGNI